MTSWCQISLSPLVDEDLKLESPVQLDVIIMDEKEDEDGDGRGGDDDDVAGDDGDGTGGDEDGDDDGSESISSDLPNDDKLTYTLLTRSADDITLMYYDDDGDDRKRGTLVTSSFVSCHDVSVFDHKPSERTLDVADDVWTSSVTKNLGSDIKETQLADPSLDHSLDNSRSDSASNHVTDCCHLTEILDSMLADCSAKELDQVTDLDHQVATGAEEGLLVARTRANASVLDQLNMLVLPPGGDVVSDVSSTAASAVEGKGGFMGRI